MINRVIRNLIFSDSTLWFSIGLLAPIFAVFVIQNINGGTLQVVGIAVSSYWAARTLTTVPIGIYMDKTKGERDEYYFMLVGSYFMTVMPLLYIFSTIPLHLYLIGIANGVAASMAIPGWRILFTHHLDKGSTGYEWSVEDVGVGIAIAVSSYLGAYLAGKFGFEFLFVLIAAIGVIGVTVFILPLYKYAHIAGGLKRSRVKKLSRSK